MRAALIVRAVRIARVALIVLVVRVARTVRTVELHSVVRGAGTGAMWKQGRGVWEQGRRKEGEREEGAAPPCGEGPGRPMAAGDGLMAGSVPAGRGWA